MASFRYGFHGLMFVSFGFYISRFLNSHLKSRYVCLPFIIARLDDREKMIVQTGGDRFETILPTPADPMDSCVRPIAPIPSHGPTDEKVRREQSERPTPLSTLYFCHFENKRGRRDQVGTRDLYAVPCQKDIQHLSTRGGTNEVI